MDYNTAKKEAESQIPPPLRNNAPAARIAAYTRLARTSFQEFVRTESFSGMLLLVCAVVAMIWANSAYADAYNHFFHTPVSVGFGKEALTKSLVHWINDGLMVIFFFVVGLEIKRETLVGELSSVRKAVLPAVTALGGMLAPAGLYLMLNTSGPAVNGWGVPMATDIAFALGILMLAGRRAPVGAKVFLTAMAIVDDIGAIIVIALFYTTDIQAMYLYYGLGLFGAMLLMNLLGFRVTLVYSALGVALWFFFLKSGVHATVAGVLLAFVIPASPDMKARSFCNRLGNLTGEFSQTFENEENKSRVRTRQTRMLLLEEMYNSVHRAHSPLERLEHGLKSWSAYFILPIFALANAGVTVTAEMLGHLLHPVFWGIVLGLFFGKQIGVFGAAWLAIKFGLADRPERVSWPMIYSLSVLGGIGFTMALFIAELGFKGQTDLLPIAKIGILTATMIASVVGFILVKYNAGKLSEREPA